MPFTPSHAIVALPFIRTPLPAAAVAVGAMTPDLPLFVRAFPEDYGMTHSFTWLPLTVVVALGLLIVWRCVLRPATRELSPRWLASRLPREWDAGAGAGLRGVFARRGQERSSWVGALVVLVALTIGVVSHIVWDSFTHEGRWGMTALDLAVMWGPLPAYKWLQYGSSIGGVIVLALWAMLWLRRRRPGPVTRVLPAWLRWSWWIALPVLLVAAWTIGYLRWGPFTADFGPQHLGYRVLPLASAVWVGLGLLLALAVPAVRRARS
jgi:hypothetical protein